MRVCQLPSAFCIWSVLDLSACRTLETLVKREALGFLMVTSNSTGAPPMTAVVGAFPTSRVTYSAETSLVLSARTALPAASRTAELSFTVDTRSDQ